MFSALGNRPQPQPGQPGMMQPAMAFVTALVKPFTGTGQYAHLTVSNPRQWTTERTQCEPSNECFMALCFPPCVVGMTRAALDGSDCWFHGIFSTWVHTYHTTRVWYDIQGDNGEDILMSIFCPVCNIRQAFVETKLRQMKVWTRPIAPGARATPWKYELLSCTPETGCYVCLCPQCASARTLNMYDGTNCWVNLCFSTPCYVTNTIRHGYGIQGDSFMDIVSTLFCYPCAISRNSSEVLARLVEAAVERAKTEVQQRTAGMCSCCGGGSRVQPMK
eukprot:PhF_6_TR30757/c0_g1_i1/m.45294